MSEIVDKIIANADEMFEAQKLMKHPRQLSEVEKQAAYVDGSSNRCLRCGDITIGLFPGSAPFCGACIAHFRELDMADHGGEFWWFSKMLSEIKDGEKANATQG